MSTLLVSKMADGSLVPHELKCYGCETWRPQTTGCVTVPVKDKIGFPGPIHLCEDCAPKSAAVLLKLRCVATGAPDSWNTPMDIMTREGRRSREGKSLPPSSASLR
jgi:hypothetical protein